MTEPIDLNKRRFEKAISCEDISASHALREALRQVESGEWSIDSVIIIGLFDDKETPTVVDCMHGGPATTNDRIAMTVRATNILVQP